MSEKRPLWRPSHPYAEEPPPEVRKVRSVRDGHVMVRAADVDQDGIVVPAGTCDYCEPPSTWWTWLHNGNSACWLDMDFVGPVEEVR